jgi:helix-turn-helix protein
MTIRQAAEKAQRDESTLRHAIKTGKLKARRISPKVILIEDADLQAWLKDDAAHKRGPRHK